METSKKIRYNPLIKQNNHKTRGKNEIYKT